MKRKWLWFVAAAVIAGACACGGGEKGKESGAGAEAGLEAGESMDEEAEGDKDEGGKTAGEVKEPESGSGDEAKGEESGKGDNEGSREDGNGESPADEESGEGINDGEYGDFTTGTWDGLTFSNPWLNVAVTFPEGSAVFSEEDMKKLVGDSGEILVNSGNYEDIRSRVSDALNVYDFMVTMPDGRSSVQLAYLNAKKVAPGQAISAEDCLRQMAEELSAIGDMGYELGEMRKAEIGGREFDCFSASLMGGALYQEYYAVRAGDYVAMLTASYEAEGKTAVEALIEGIREAR